MKRIPRFLILLFVLAPAAVRADGADAAYEDIRRTLGQVPTFLKDFPREAIAAVWDEYKGTELNPNSALPGKVKELIGLAVAAQIPCRYCVYFHRSAAQLQGATDAEIKEALAIASLTRQWSTVLNGMQVNEEGFRGELKRVFAYVVSPKAKAAKSAPITDAASAYADMERTLGLVPTFFKRFPSAGIAGAWREYKTIELGSKTALSGKHKELIGLAVAAQVPCRYCTWFHTEAAKLNGATDTEVREAVAMAAITRHWSTFLNGMLYDETAFRREVDQIMAYLRRQASR